MHTHSEINQKRYRNNSNYTTTSRYYQLISIVGAYNIKYVPRVLVVRIVDFGRRRRIVAETAVVAAVQARVAVRPAAGPLVDRPGFAGRRRQRLRRWREKRGRRRYVSAVLTRHHRRGHGRRRWTVAVRPTVGPGPRLCAENKTRFRAVRTVRSRTRGRRACERAVADSGAAWWEGGSG